MHAERSGNGFKLSGKKQFVVQGASADMLIVAARTGGSAGEEDGITLFAVEKDAAGLSADAARLVDSAMGAEIFFDNVEVTADAVIGEVDQGWKNRLTNIRYERLLGPTSTSPSPATNRATQRAKTYC